MDGFKCQHGGCSVYKLPDVFPVVLPVPDDDIAAEVQRLNENMPSSFCNLDQLVVLTECVEDDRPQLRSSPSDMELLYPQLITTTTPTGRLGQKALGNLWVRHPKRRQYQGIELRRMVAAIPITTSWRGFAVEPVRGEWPSSASI